MSIRTREEEVEDTRQGLQVVMAVTTRKDEDSPARFNGWITHSLFIETDIMQFKRSKEWGNTYRNTVHVVDHLKKIAPSIVEQNGESAVIVGLVLIPAYRKQSILNPDYEIVNIFRWPRGLFYNSNGTLIDQD